MTFTAAGVLSLLLPSITPREVLTPSVEYEELHAPTIVATSWAFTAIRAAVGFFVFGLAFALRRASEPTWMYGAAIAAYGAGTYLGNAVAPLLRRRFGEDRLTAGALGALAIVLAFAALGPSRALVLLVSLVLGGVAAVARQGFDAMVQTHAPMATRGRSFARFETRFQLGWVAGARGRHGDRHPDPLQPGRARRPAAAVRLVVRRRPARRARRPTPRTRSTRWRSPAGASTTPSSGTVATSTASPSPSSPASSTSPARPGVDLDVVAVVRLDALRAAALSTWPLDSREVEWAMTYAGVARRAPRPGAGRCPTRAGRRRTATEPDAPTPPADQDSAGRRPTTST